MSSVKVSDRRVCLMCGQDVKLLDKILLELTVIENSPYTDLYTMERVIKFIEGLK